MILLRLLASSEWDDFEGLGAGILTRSFPRLSRDNLILRDFLAVDRTVLANERTFLAYVRTALALVVAGASFVRFFDTIGAIILGWIFMPLGAITLAVGVRRYITMSLLISTGRLDETDAASSRDTN